MKADNNDIMIHATLPNPKDICSVYYCEELQMPPYLASSRIGKWETRKRRLWNGFGCSIHIGSFP